MKNLQYYFPRPKHEKKRPPIIQTIPKPTPTNCALTCLVNSKANSGRPNPIFTNVIWIPEFVSFFKMFIVSPMNYF